MNATNTLVGAGGRDRIARAWDAFRASFGFPSGLAMVAGLALGLGLPEVDGALGIDLPVLSFESQSSARSLLETIGTTTVAVAGLAFSVTVVAFTLASSQLSPRVLRNFRRDRLSQITLALFLGTFIYCLALLVRLGISGDGAEPPNLSITLAVVLAFVSFATFAGFVAHIVGMLQPSSVIDGIRADGVDAVSDRYPSGRGEPDDEAGAMDRARSAAAETRPRPVEAGSSGYLDLVDLDRLIASAEEFDGLVLQRAPVGRYVLPGETLAEIRADSDEAADELESHVRDAFHLARQRTTVQDVAFPVRQLADIALKGLSPGINDPTTAVNALEAMAVVLIRHAEAERPSPVRVGEDGQPRLIAVAPELDDLVREGFDQVRIHSWADPAVSIRILELLDELERSARRAGHSTAEINRQRRLMTEGVGSDGPTESDIDRVRDAGTAMRRSERRDATGR